MALYRVTVSDTRTYVISAEQYDEAVAEATERFNLCKHKIDCSIPLTPCQTGDKCPYEGTNSPITDCGKCFTYHIRKEFAKK